MTADQWASLEQHFAELCELPLEARGERLAAIADDEVRQEVASLLAHSGEEGTTVSMAVQAMAASVEYNRNGESDDALQQQRIGVYRLVRRLGQGGQGAVYEAVRDDGSFDQRVAIKIVKWEVDSEDARRQFRHERQILAGLEHPHIARLLDGGETVEGTPYLVMEFIEGRPLTAATEDWPLRRKLQLFLQIAEAVTFAHRNLIVHRDLKPANILVTTGGTPKLLDFGIAKLLDANAQGTITGFQALTPEYASPEQVRGEAITTASDVYSLGVVLYQMLTGRRPYEVPTASPMDIHKAVCLTEPASPGLSEDLDNILLMAMRKEAARRYSSVEQFARDIERSLTHRPVLARPDTFTYRAGRFVRRNRLVLTASAAVVLAVAGGTGAALQQARISRQRFEQVRRLAHSFVFDYNDDLARIEGTTKVREKMVRTALEYLDNLSTNAVGDLNLQRELASAYQRIGDAQGYPTKANLGHTDQAVASYRKAAAIHEHVASRDPLYRKELGDFYTSFAMLLQFAGDSPGADRMAEAAFENTAQIARERPDDEDAQARYARAGLQLGDNEEDRGRSTAAYLKDKEADRIARAVLSRWQDRAALQLAQSARERIGTAALGSGRLQEALTLFDEDEKLLDRLLAIEPTNPGFRRSRAVLAQFRANAYFDDISPCFDDPARSLEYARQYLDFTRKMVEADPQNASARFSLAVALFRLSYPLKFSDREGAVASARESVALFDELVASGKNGYLVVSRRVRALRRLSEALLAAGLAGEARVRALEALAAERNAVRSDPRSLQEATILSQVLVTAAQAEDEMHNAGAAAAYLQEAEEITVRLHRGNPNEFPSAIPLANTYRAAARHWKKAGDAARAEQSLAAVRTLWHEFPVQNEYARRQLAATQAR